MSKQDNTSPLLTLEEMFKEHDTLYLKWIGAPFYLCMLALYSYITVQLTGTSYWVTPISWFVDMLIFYAWHVQAHHRLEWIPFNELCHKWHNDHHFKFFPANYFYGSEHAKEWIEGSNKGLYLISQSLPLHELSFFESLQNESFGLFMAVLTTLVKYYVICLPIPVIVATLIQGFLVNFVGNYLHLSFHVRNHWLSNYKLYRELKWLHYLHHCGDTQHNYAIFFFGIDKMFETYHKKKHE